MKHLTANVGTIPQSSENKYKIQELIEEKKTKKFIKKCKLTTWRLNMKQKKYKIFVKLKR